MKTKHFALVVLLAVLFTLIGCGTPAVQKTATPIPVTATEAVAKSGQYSGPSDSVSNGYDVGFDLRGLSVSEFHLLFYKDGNYCGELFGKSFNLNPDGSFKSQIEDGPFTMNVSKDGTASGAYISNTCSEADWTATWQRELPPETPTPIATAVPTNDPNFQLMLTNLEANGYVPNDNVATECPKFCTGLVNLKDDVSAIVYKDGHVMFLLLPGASTTPDDNQIKALSSTLNKLFGPDTMNWFQNNYSDVIAIALKNGEWNTLPSENISGYTMNFECKTDGVGSDATIYCMLTVTPQK